MKKSFLYKLTAAGLSICMCISLSACNNPVQNYVDNAVSTVEEADVYSYNSQAKLIYESASLYATKCTSNGTQIEPGVYRGKLNSITSENYTKDGSGSDLGNALGYLMTSNGSSGGYYYVVIGESGFPSAAYFSDSDKLLSVSELSGAQECTREFMIGGYPDQSYAS